MPEELADSELCEIYGWTWDELQATPYYVRRSFLLIQQMKGEHRAELDKRARAGMG